MSENHHAIDVRPNPTCAREISEIYSTLFAILPKIAFDPRLKSNHKAVLLGYAQLDKPLSIGQVATKLGLSRKTTGECLAHLVELGYLDKRQTIDLDGMHEYRLTIPQQIPEGRLGPKREVSASKREYLRKKLPASKAAKLKEAAHYLNECPDIAPRDFTRGQDVWNLMDEIEREIWLVDGYFMCVKLESGND